MYLPNDPALLKSILNTYLRDKYETLESLCDDLDLNQDEIISKMENAGYAYLSDIRQFR